MEIPVSREARHDDGRYTVFTSDAANLVGGDNNQATDVFVYDRQLNVIKLVSINRDGTGSGNGASDSPMISADGKVVAFQSKASDLVSNDTNGHVTDVFVRDLGAATPTTVLASVNRDGTGSGNNASLTPVLSANGKVVAFRSYASNLAGNDPNRHCDVFVRDLGAVTPTTVLVSVNAAGTESGNARSRNPALSADGKVVAFSSFAHNLVSNDNSGLHADVFVRDLGAVTPTTVLVSVNSAGTSSGRNASDHPVLSADGKTVVFESWANDLVAGDTNHTRDVFLATIPPSNPGNETGE